MPSSRPRHTDHARHPAWLRKDISLQKPVAANAGRLAALGRLSCGRARVFARCIGHCRLERHMLGSGTAGSRTEGSAQRPGTLPAIHLHHRCAPAAALSRGRCTHVAAGRHTLLLLLAHPELAATAALPAASARCAGTTMAIFSACATSIRREGLRGTFHALPCNARNSRSRFGTGRPCSAPPAIGGPGEPCGGPGVPFVMRMRSRAHRSRPRPRPHGTG